MRLETKTRRQESGISLGSGQRSPLVWTWKSDAEMSMNKSKSIAWCTFGRRLYRLAPDSVQAATNTEVCGDRKQSDTVEEIAPKLLPVLFGDLLDEPVLCPVEVAPFVRNFPDGWTPGTPSYVQKRPSDQEEKVSR